MAIEIDYFAWEKWRQAEHQETYMKFLPYHFFQADSSWRLQQGHLILSVCYWYYFNNRRTINDSIEYSYELIADSPNGQISKLLKISHDRAIDWQRINHPPHDLEDWHLYFEFVDLDEFTATKLQELIDTIPSFSLKHRSNMVDISLATLSTRDIIHTQFHLRLNGEEHRGKTYIWDSAHIAYISDNETADKLEQILKHIMLTCDALTGQMESQKPQMRKLVQNLETIFTENGLYKIPNRYHPPFPENIASCEDWSLASWHPQKYRLEEIYNYSSEVISDCASREDFKRFLPRLLDMLNECKETVIGEAKDYDICLLQTILQKLNLTAWQTWDKSEQELIKVYFLTAWDYLLSYYPSRWLNVEDFILSLVINRHDLSPYLAIWNIQSEYALRHAAALIRHSFNLSQIHSNQLLRIPDNLWEWLMRDDLDTELIRAYTLTENKRPYAHEFAEALESLELIRLYRAE